MDMKETHFIGYRDKGRFSKTGLATGKTGGLVS